MKTIKKGLLLLLSVVLSIFMIMPGTTVSAGQRASGSCGTNATWTLTDAGVLTISGTGAMTSSPWTSNYKKDIRKVIISKGITTIVDEAFSHCSNLASIEIPNSVTSIGYRAFEYCFDLTSIEIPNGVTSIGESAFYSCSFLKGIEISNSVTSIGKYAFSNCNSLTSIEIPNSVTSIGESAFSFCSGLTSIEIPNSVTSISNGLFFNCRDLTSIEIPSSVTSIGDTAFYNCSGLTSIGIPNSVTSIGDSTFSSCSGLTSIEIPNSVTSIRDNAFLGCDGLTSIEIPSSVTSIGPGVFSECNKLTSIVVNNQNSTYDSRNRCNAIICKEDNSLIVGCKSTIIPNSVTSIGESAFYKCNSLTSIEIPNSVTSIGESAFLGCDGLTSIEIPNSVTSIGESAFALCSGLTSIEIPNSVTSIGDNAFWGCDGLTSIEIPNSVTSIGESAFYKCNSLTSIEIPNSVTTIGREVFYGCYSLTSIEIPKSVTSIDKYAFNYCSSLTSIKIHDGVTSIGYMAFASCSNLTSIEIPNSVTSIGREVFYGCNNVTIYSHNEVIHKYAKENNITYIDRHILKKTEAVSATTSSSGNKEYYACDLCGKYFSDEEATNEIVENSWVIAPIVVNTPEMPTNNITAPANKGDNPSTNNNTSPVTDDGTVITGIQSVCLNKENFTYSGKAIKAKVIVTDTNGNIITSDNYDLSYSKSLKNVGTKTVTVTFKGSYSGSKTLKYNVIPKNVSKIKVKKGSKAITVSWKKQSKQTSGYQIEYSTKKNFKNAKRISIKDIKKISTSIKSKTGKKYYIRIRTYKKVGSKIYYSTWSKTKK